jgi:RHS repeat-associated protein
MNDFSNPVLAPPNTAMVIKPGVPADTPYSEQPVTADPSYSPPPTQAPGTFVNSNYEGPVGVTGIFNGNVTTGCSYDPLGHSAHRAVDDLVVPGSIGKYPLKMTRYYNSRQQYYAAGIALGPGWAHEYSWLWGSGNKLISPHGSVYDPLCGEPVGVSEAWEGTDWRLADGGRVHFDGTTGRCTYIKDPYGLTTTIDYSNNRIWRVTEPGGRCLIFTYGPAQDRDGTLLLTKVEAYDRYNGNRIDSVNYSYHEYDPISPPILQRKKMMLTGVSYSDGTSSATYDYRTDNVHEGQTSHKMYPVLQRADDVRYNGPMRTIRYEYQGSGPHGAIVNEKYPDTGAVSAISPGAVFGPPTIDTFTETRGDGPNGQGPPRSFTYTHMMHCQNECTPCDDYELNDAYPYRAPQQMLTSYTDFQGHTTYLDYDSTWYISAVRDARSSGPTDPTYKTDYLRGPSPPAGIGEIHKITHPDSTYIQYAYWTETEPNAIQGHYLQRVTDENGKITALTRDNHYRITRIDYPSDGNTPVSYEEFTYNDFGQVLTHHLKNGAWESFAYDGRGLLTDKYNPKFGSAPGVNDPHAHYEYYTAADGKPGWIDRIKTMTMPANWYPGYQASETYEYDMNSGNQPCAGRGLITKITHSDPDNSYQSSRYDQFGNKVDEWNELFENTHYVYDDYNRVRSVTRANETTAYTYNPTNGGASPYLHTTSNPDTITSPTNILTSNVYDQNFRKTSTSVAGRTTWFRYDNVGNQDCVTDPRGSGPCSPSTFSTSTHYDARNRKWYIDDAQGHRTTFTYDIASNVTDISRPDTLIEHKGYDALNRVIWHKVPYRGGDYPLNLITLFEYNPSGTIHKVTLSSRDGNDSNPDHWTMFGYDASDRRITMSYQNNQTESWEYDNAGNMKWRVTVGGRSQYFVYDQRNRKYQEVWWDQPNNDSRWYYLTLDHASRLRRAQNGTGDWTVFANPISDVHRDYYPTGKLMLEQQRVLDQPNGPGLPTRKINYEYDLQYIGAEVTPTRMHVTDGNGTELGYDYDFRCDNMGRFEKILVGGAVKFLYSYDNASNETLRHNNINGVDQVYTPDTLNRIGSIDLQKNGSFAHEDYGYDEMSRLTSVTREGNRQDRFGYYWDGELYWGMYSIDGVQAANSSEIPPAQDPSKEKTVDDFLSLTGWDPNLALTADRTVSYAYDKAGNRTSLSDSVNGNIGYTPNNINQYIGQVGNDPITNGPEHEVATYKTVSYTYKNDLLTNVTSGANNYDLAYDALGRCVKRTVNGVIKYYIYDGERPILEYKSNGDLAARNLYGKGIDEILMRYDPTLTQEPRTFYYQQDHEGSVTHLTDGSGTVIEKYRYDAFGTPTIYDAANPPHVRTASIVSNRFLFTGREYAANFGFYEYRARAYHPGLGRFMSEDPKLFDAGDYNLFRYCHNDPIDFTDPMGLEEVDVEFRAFIPQANVGYGPVSFRGDNRGFSSDRTASSRVSVSVRVETDAAKNHGNPMIGKPNIKVSPTHFNLTGQEKTSTGPKMPQVRVTQDKSGNVNVNVQENVRNPFQPAGQGIKADVNISVNQNATQGSVHGSISGAPSFETNFTRQDGQTTNLQLQTAPQRTDQFILQLRQTNEVERNIDLPPTKPQ